MTKHPLADYRDLATLSTEAWQALDIHLYILANCDRYGLNVMRRIGLKHLPSDVQDILPGLFCDVSYRPLKKLHGEHLSAQGERRNQLMLGTLKQIAVTRMVEAVIREFPSYVSLTAFDDEIERLDGSAEPDSDWAQPQRHTASLAAFYAASSEVIDDEEYDHTLAAQEAELSCMLEQVRAQLTPTQYKHLRLVVCDRLSYREIAQQTGHSVTNVRSVLLNARKRLMDFAVEHAWLNADDIAKLAV